jgi:CheY-like chemotaxis protein
MQKVLNNSAWQQRTTVPAILLAEDQPNDVILMRLAMERAGLDNPLFALPDGAEVLEYLSATGRYRDRSSHPLPRLLLLDLKMPAIDGFDVLEWLQHRPQFRQMAKVVLSSSNLEADILRAKSLGADDYLVKPNNYSDLVHLVMGLSNRWLSVVPNSRYNEGQALSWLSGNRA